MASENLAELLVDEWTTTDISDVVKNADITSLACHDKLIVVGDSQGEILAFDHNGHRINSIYLPKHEHAVTSLLVDRSGEYVIAGSRDDGKITISNVTETDASRLSRNVHQFATPLELVLIPTTFAQINNFIFVANGRLYLNERVKFIHSYRCKELCSGLFNVGPQCVAWLDQYVAYMSNPQICSVHDVKSGNTSRCTLPFPSSSNHACLLWSNHWNLLIGCDKKLSIIKVKQTSASSFLLNTVADFDINNSILSIGLFGLQCVALMMRPAEKADSSCAGSTTVDDCVFQIVEPLASKCKVLMENRLRHANKLTMDFIHNVNQYYVSNGSGVSVIRAPDTADRVRRLIDERQFEEAMDMFDKHQVLKSSGLYLELTNHINADYLEKGLYEKAATLAAQRFTTPQQWKDQIDAFKSDKNLQLLAPVLPLDDHMVSNDSLVEFVRYLLLHGHHKCAMELIGKLPANSDVFNQIIILLNDTEQSLVSSSVDVSKLQLLGQLYAKTNQIDKALGFYINAKDLNSFVLIHDNEKWEELLNNAARLFEIDKKETCDLLAEATKSFKVETIMNSIQSIEELQHMYLHQVFVSDQSLSQSYHQIQLTLYLKYSRDNLLQFLQQSKFLNLQHAFEFCQSNRLLTEVVYLMSRLGKHREALMFTLNELRDVEKAVDLCRELGDPLLWMDLVQFCKNDKGHMRLLLRSVGTNISPELLFSDINTDITVADLRSGVEQIIQDFKLQEELQKKTDQLQSTDVLANHDEVVNKMSRGFIIHPTSLCDLCNMKLGGTIGGFARDIAVLPDCGHMYHSDCLELGENRQTVDCIKCLYTDQ